MASNWHIQSLIVNLSKGVYPLGELTDKEVGDLSLVLIMNRKDLEKRFPLSLYRDRCKKLRINP